MSGLSVQEKRQIEACVRGCRFFSAEQALVWVINAYREAVSELRPPAGEPWVVEGVAWSGPVEFADAFEHHLKRRFWDACERSQVYRDAREKQAVFRKDEAVFCAPQEHTLPHGSTIDPAVMPEAGSSC